MVEPVVKVHVLIKVNIRERDGVELVESFCSCFISVGMWIIITQLFTYSFETLQFLHYTEIKKNIYMRR